MICIDVQHAKDTFLKILMIEPDLTFIKWKMFFVLDIDDNYYGM